MTRFTIPVVAEPSAIQFPPVDRSVLDNGVRVCTITQAAVPVVSLAVLLDAGTSADPPDRPGLSSLVAALVTEGAGARDSIAMADALARIGARLDVVPGSDATIVTLSTIARHTDAAIQILADVIRRPRLAAADFQRVRELRLSRLRQSSRVAATIADRALIAAVYGSHPYGHGALGTTRAIEAITLDEARAFWQAQWTPVGAAFVASGDVDAPALSREVARAFADWGREHAGETLREQAPPPDRPGSRVVAVHRPGAAQAEVRVGHLGPPRRTHDYYSLVTLNALLGGQFTSRINRNLRESRAITYGARTNFEMRRVGGMFSADTAVQADAAAVAATEIVREMRDVAVAGSITTEELARAQASLTRGYARHFETPGQLARALEELVVHQLAADTFDRFVPEVLRLKPADVTHAAQMHLRPDDSAVVVVTDLDKHLNALEALGSVGVTEVEF